MFAQDVQRSLETPAVQLPDNVQGLFFGFSGHVAAGDKADQRLRQVWQESDEEAVQSRKHRGRSYRWIGSCSTIAGQGLAESVPVDLKSICNYLPIPKYFNEINNMA
ncbi:hypothetical protein ES703_118649 [subsurface metagenome]